MLFNSTGKLIKHKMSEIQLSYVRVGRETTQAQLCFSET